MPNHDRGFPVDQPPDHDAADTVEVVAAALQARSLTLAVAESLTGGLLANRFAVASEASRWFKGGVVVARVLEADASVAVTGVGRPDEQDGQPPGTVWIAVRARTSTIRALGCTAG